MARAAGAGAAFFAGDMWAIPLANVIAELIDFSDQLLIISERLQFRLPFLDGF